MTLWLAASLFLFPAGAQTITFADITSQSGIRFIREWKRYNQSLTELSRLGDRELADIGISRSDIHRVAWKASPSTRAVVFL